MGKWRQKFEKPQQLKMVVIDKPYAGIMAGSRVLIGTPRLVADYIEAIPCGETREIPQMRSELAKQHDCQAMDPMSTAMLIRIAAATAIEDMQSGVAVSGVIPFWRLLKSSDRISRRLDIDSAWLDNQRQGERAN